MKVGLAGDGVVGIMYEHGITLTKTKPFSFLFLCCFVLGMPVVAWGGLVNLDWVISDIAYLRFYLAEIFLGEQYVNAESEVVAYYGWFPSREFFELYFVFPPYSLASLGFADARLGYKPRRMRKYNEVAHSYTEYGIEISNMWSVYPIGLRMKYRLHKEMSDQLDYLRIYEEASPIEKKYMALPRFLPTLLL